MGLSHQEYDLDVLFKKDSENILQSYERFLIAVHSVYFKSLKKHRPVCDTRLLSEFMRSFILQGTHLVFSGVFPKEVPFLRNREVVIAQSFGATVYENLSDSIEEKSITHLICARKNTDKYRKALSMGIHLVSPQWLWASVFHFKKMNESDFPVESSNPYCEVFASELLSVSEFVKKTCDEIESTVASLEEDTEQPQQHENEEPEACYFSEEDFEELDAEFNESTNDDVEKSRKRKRTDEDEDSVTKGSEIDENDLDELGLELEAEFEAESE